MFTDTDPQTAIKKIACNCHADIDGIYVTKAVWNHILQRHEEWEFVNLEELLKRIIGSTDTDIAANQRPEQIRLESGTEIRNNVPTAIFFGEGFSDGEHDVPGFLTVYVSLICEEMIENYLRVKSVIPKNSTPRGNTAVENLLPCVKRAET